MLSILAFCKLNQYRLSIKLLLDPHTFQLASAEVEPDDEPSPKYNHVSVQACVQVSQRNVRTQVLPKTSAFKKLYWIFTDTYQPIISSDFVKPEKSIAIAQHQSRFITPDH